MLVNHVHTLVDKLKNSSYSAVEMIEMYCSMVFDTMGDLLFGGLLHLPGPSPECLR